ncbi:hypothetical protein [Actinomadura macra]|uniref:hypothetical protein n=1 Tax=Actinomadura macra TaxID=46164 RepID=UPI0012FCC479|nr:hypothetical protein [Actinomadura macra]
MTSLAKMIQQWERGDHIPGPIYRPLYAHLTGTSEAELFGLAKEGRTPNVEALNLAGTACLSEVNSRPVDAEFVESLRETNQDLVRLDALWGGHEVFPLALRVFRTVHQKLGSGAYVPPVERDLLAAAGETGEIAAWLAYDADKQPESRQLAHEALMLSQHAGDRDMELFLLSHLAMQSLYLRRPADAMRIVTASLGDEVPPRVAALFEVRRGRALAQLGDGDSASDAFDLAESTIAESITSRDPRWTWWVDGTELTRHRATAHTQLGQWDRAVPLRERVVEGCQGRYLYGKLDLAQLLEALVHVHDWQRAEDVITDVSSIVESLGPGRSANLLRRVFDQISGESGAPSTVMDAASELRGLLPQTQALP